MKNISELDLQNLRHLIGGCSTTYEKMVAYEKDAKNPKVKAFFKQAADSTLKNKQALMKFLQ